MARDTRFEGKQEWTDVGPVFSFSVGAIGERFKFEFAGWETELLDWTRYSKSVDPSLRGEIKGCAADSADDS